MFCKSPLSLASPRNAHFSVLIYLFLGGTQKSIGEGISAIYQGTIIRLAVGFPDIIRVVLEIGEEVAIGIGAGLISAWLYDKLKERKVEKLRIERIEVRIDKGEIERILIEKIEQK